MRDLYYYHELEDMYEEQLNECYETVSICGMNYDQGHALRNLDPIAFRCNVSDWDSEEDVRFIHEDSILEVLEDELAADEYILGCFKAWTIAEATGWPMALIEAAQKGEQYEEIGKAMTGEHVAELAQIYAQHDGYGHHFNHYDGSEEEFTIDGQTYFVFDNH